MIALSGAGSRRGLLVRSLSLRALAPWLMGISVVVRLIDSIPRAQTPFVDLHVYYLGQFALDRPGTLYDVVYTDLSGEHLPFIYPPFAAMVLYPLRWLNFWVAAWAWQLAIIAALYGVVWLSLRMIGRGSHRTAMLWTAVGVWFEPIRVGMDCSQVGVFLTLAALYAVYSSRSWVSGSLVGLAAGFKLTPAITALYFIGMRRWKAAAIAGGTFLATVGLSALVVPGDTANYFTGVIGRFAVPIATALNQSWRGTISRIVGHDVGDGIVVYGAVAATAVLAVLAWRALGSGERGRDAFGSLLVVQLFGLMVPPISWVHHWVWAVPLTIWLLLGPWSAQRGARVLGWAWFALLYIGFSIGSSQLQATPWIFSRPWYLAWGQAVYAPMAMITFAWIIYVGWTSRRVRETDAAPGVANSALL